MSYDTVNKATARKARNLEDVQQRIADMVQELKSMREMEAALVTDLRRDFKRGFYFDSPDGYVKELRFVGGTRSILDRDAVNKKFKGDPPMKTIRIKPQARINYVMEDDDG